jgi:hypothetical protein
MREPERFEGFTNWRLDCCDEGGEGPNGKEIDLKSLEGKMSKKAAEHHVKAAEQHEHAAKHHREAARLHEAGDPKAAAHHAHLAQGHLHKATRHAADEAELYIIEAL